MTLPTDYQQLIHRRTYARWLEKEKRRETWDETVNRFRDYFEPRVPQEIMDDFTEAIYSIRKLEVMPSMRSLWTAGRALDADNVAGYNCAYTPIAHPRDFAEVLHILMNGAGVGISVERQYTNKLHPVPEQFMKRTGEEIVFADSKRGWAEGFYKYLVRLWRGQLVECNLEKIRPAGARLKTFGGRASGPGPLRELINFTKHIFINARGRKLSSEEVADICCKIAECVIVGGVRRSAILILTNPSDRRMAKFKKGEFWLTHPHRALANISACYTETPDVVSFTEDFLDLMRSGTGERGIVNREALKSMSPPWRDTNHEFGVNPCGEVILRPKQFCNLTEVVIRPASHVADIEKQIKHAVLLGVLQSTLTNFGFISKEWKKNTEEERLLGVSLTGIMDWIRDKHMDVIYRKLRETAHSCAEYYAGVMGINVPTAVTCVKPSGTVSQLVDCSPGLHPRFSHYYMRRIRVASTDPIAQFLIDQGVPASPENGEQWETCRTVVFHFPMKASPGATVTEDMTAIGQLNWWKKVKKFYTDHNPSVTIHVNENEWPKVMSWIWNEWDIIGGITMLPADGGHFQLMPYEEITEEEYSMACQMFPEIDWFQFPAYESTDETTGAQELACAGGGCDI